MRLFIAFFLSVGCGLPGQGQLDHVFVYVDHAGPGPGSGTSTDPFLTIQDAINYVWDHDFILVRPGVYQEVVDLPYFVFMRSTDGPERTVIDATGLPGTHAVTLATLAEVTGFTVTKRDGAGILAEVMGGAQAAPEYGRIIRGNRVVECPQGGLHLRGPTHAVVVENVIASNGSFGIKLEDGASPWLTGNTVTGCPVGMLVLGNAPDTTSMFGNSIFFGNVIDVQGLAPARFRHCVVGDPTFAAVNGCLNADPLFVNAGSYDVRLAPLSPCIDAADDLIVPYSSTFDGRGLGALRRVDGNHDGQVQSDIGAMERGGLQLAQIGTGVGSVVTLEIDTGPLTMWLLGVGALSENPTAPVNGASGYLFLELPTLALAASGFQGALGLTSFTLTINDPTLIGLRLTLQAVSVGAPIPLLSTAFTNAEVFTIR